jgi:hypothetical protein
MTTNVISSNSAENQRPESEFKLEQPYERYP